MNNEKEWYMLRSSHHLSHLITFYNSLQLDWRAYSFLQQLLSILIVVRSFINREHIIDYRYCWHRGQMCLYSIAFLCLPLLLSLFLLQLSDPSAFSLPPNEIIHVSPITQQSPPLSFRDSLLSPSLPGWLVDRCYYNSTPASIDRSSRVGSLLLCLLSCRSGPQGVSLFTRVLLLWIHHMYQVLAGKH